MARSARSAADDLLADLEAARSDLEDVNERIEAIGEAEVERVAAVFEEFTDLLAEYENSATGTGREEFQSFVEFEGRIADFEEGLAADLPEREAFEEACERLDRRRLDERDFERAREALAPAREKADLLEEREAAKERVREAESAVEARIREIDDRLDDLGEITAFADADFEADVSVLREPIEAYDGAAREAFRQFRREEPARRVLGFVEATEAYPLVEYRAPPEGLREYVGESEVGEEPIPTLLEYADYSRSKLAHYVDEPATFRREIAANRTYLERLDAAPLTIGWPPPPADELRWEIEELIAVTGRFAPEDVVERLRSVRDRARRVDYGSIRETARAREELSAADRERLRSGEIEAEIEDLRAERDRLRDALAD